MNGITQAAIRKHSRTHQQRHHTRDTNKCHNSTGTVLYIHRSRQRKRARPKQGKASLSQKQGKHRTKEDAHSMRIGARNKQLRTHGGHTLVTNLRIGEASNPGPTSRNQRRALTKIHKMERDVAPPNREEGISKYLKISTYNGNCFNTAIK